jgi:hypothetical protein
MEIDHYSFGRIGIGGPNYNADVIIFPGHVQERWWRREGHRLAQEDLEIVLADAPLLHFIRQVGFEDDARWLTERLAHLEGAIE